MKFWGVLEALCKASNIKKMFHGVTVGDNTHRFRIKPHPLHKSLRFNFRCQSLSSLSMVLLSVLLYILPCRKSPYQTSKPH